MEPELKAKLLHNLNTREPYTQHNHIVISDIGEGTSRIELDLNKTWVFDGKCALTCSCYYLVASSGCELGQS